MIAIIAPILFLFAILAWILALISAVRIVALAPKGQRVRNYYRLGWWKFADIRADLGPAADQHIRTYQRAFIAFFACIAAAAALGALLGIERQN